MLRGRGCRAAIDSFSEHILNRLAFTTPSAHEVRTNKRSSARLTAREAHRTRRQRKPRSRAHFRIRGNSILRVRIDPARERLWVLDIGNVHVLDLNTNRLVRSIALPNWYYAGHGTNCLPDLRVDAQGAAYVSNALEPKLWRIDPKDFSVHERAVRLDSRRNVDVGFSALSVSESGVMLAAMAAPGTLWRIDTNTFRAVNIPLAEPIHGACGIETVEARDSSASSFYRCSSRRRTGVERATRRIARFGLIRSTDHDRLPQ